MTAFYDAWLAQSDEIERAVAEGPRVARGKDLQWVQTRQDARAALMIAPETGFPTGGSVLMRAEIPVGWHSGAHLHGEQYLLSQETKHGATYVLMGINGKKNGFHATAVAISSIFVETPHSKSHSHAHPEAYLYALQGAGYSEIGGQRYEWEQGDAVHVP